MKAIPISSAWPILAICALLSPLGFSGCDDDDDTTRPPVVTYDHSTPAGVATALRDALAGADMVELDTLIAPAATFHLEPAEAAANGWPASLASDELQRALTNVFADAVVVVEDFTAAGDFVAAAPSSPFPNTLEADHAVALTVTPPGMESPTPVACTLRLSVEALEGGKAVSYRLAGFQEIAAQAGASFGSLLGRHLGNQPPLADLAVTPTAGEAGTEFTFDASASVDPDGAPLRYRWGGDLVDGGGWTEWTTEPTLARVWSEPGDHAASVEVRDAWGLTDAADLTVTVTPGVHDLSTPEGAAAVFAAALAGADAALLDTVLGPTAQLVVNPTEASKFGWADAMTSAEFDQAMLATLEGAVVVIENFVQLGAFAPAGPLSPFPGSFEADHEVAFLIDWPDIDADAHVVSTLRLSLATAADAREDVYFLVGLQDIDSPEDVTSFGRLLVDHLANQPPVASLTVSPASGDPGTSFTFDASGSTDVETPLELTYRFGGELAGGEEWTEWSPVNVVTRSWSTSGAHRGFVEVRDRWGLVRGADAECLVHEPWATSPNEAVTLLRDAYTSLNLTGYLHGVLDADYTFVVSEETVQRFGLPSNLLRFEEEQAIATSMFTGQPNDDGRVLTSISMPTLIPQMDWLPVAENDPYFGGASDRRWRLYEIVVRFVAAGQSFEYRVEGEQIFYVEPNLEERDGVPTERWRVCGQLDRTGAGPGPRAPAVETLDWGAVKVLFR